MLHVIIAVRGNLFKKVIAMNKTNRRRTASAVKRSAMYLSVLTVLILMLFAVVSASGTISGAGKVVTESGNLNVRRSASTNSQVLTTLKNGGRVTLLNKSGNWWQVKYGKSAYGYCHADYISELKKDKVMYVNVSGKLNVRSGAGTGYAVKTTLSRGETVVQLSVSDGWSKVLYNGTKTGYVSSRYLAEKAPSSAVRLSVADYKQKDSRWASVKLGLSYETIGSAGCTTTCLAMTESHRTGTAITPKVMASRLSYSSTGMLYWPSNYVTSTASSGYLSTILTQLRSGKPVIVGAKKANGSQHWVVVTGYNGVGLNTANFTINDPGSSTRTTLAQFFAAYPNFYKLAYSR